MAGLASPKQAQEMQVSTEDDPSIGASLKQEPANENEQAMYEALVEPMLGMIHGQEYAVKIQEKLRGGTTVGELTYEIASAVVGQIEQQGKKVPYEILQEAAQDVVEDLVEISTEMGLVEDSQDAYEQAIVEGITEAADMYGITQRKTGKISEEENAEHFDSAAKLGGFDKTKMAKALEQQLVTEQGMG